MTSAAVNTSYRCLAREGNPNDGFKAEARCGIAVCGVVAVCGVLQLPVTEPAGSSTCNAIPGPVTKPQAGMRAIHLQRCVFSRYPEFAGHGYR